MPERFESPPDDALRLPAELEPPDGLEGRVVSALHDEGLLETASRSRPWARASGAWVAAAAAGLVLGILGFALGRWQQLGHLEDDRVETAVASVGPAQYALLLYESPGFREPGREELRADYDEYSRWVALARQRRQFVTGEDFAVDRGWTLSSPESSSPESTIDARASALAPADAVLSGMFLIRATSSEEALELARQLPHLDRGGHVVVQEVLPTDQPPVE